MDPIDEKENEEASRKDQSDLSDAHRRLFQKAMCEVWKKYDKTYKVFSTGITRKQPSWIRSPLIWFVVLTIYI